MTFLIFVLFGSVLILIFILGDSISLCIHDQSETHCVQQGDLELAAASYLSLLNALITHMSHQV